MVQLTITVSSSLSFHSFVPVTYLELVIKFQAMLGMWMSQDDSYQNRIIRIEEIGWDWGRMQISLLINPCWTRASRPNQGDEQGTQITKRSSKGVGHKNGGRIQAGEEICRRTTMVLRLRWDWKKQGRIGTATVLEQTMVTGKNYMVPRGEIWFDQDFLPWISFHTFRFLYFSF